MVIIDPIINLSQSNIQFLEVVDVATEIAAIRLRGTKVSRVKVFTNGLRFRNIRFVQSAAGP